MQRCMCSMSTAPWKEKLQKALKSNAKSRESKYVQLATVRPDGKPACRTVVYRGFMGETDKPTFVTDIRSRKVHEVQHSDWGEVAWYFAQTREQFRLLGQLRVVTKDEQDQGLSKARLIAWKNMSDPGRQQFGWPHPGLDREQDEAVFHPPAPTKDDPVADTFCLVFMDVQEVDHLELKGNRRHCYTLQQQQQGESEQHHSEDAPEGGQGQQGSDSSGLGGWMVRAVNP